MALLGEYALTPDVFDAECYGSEEICRAYLGSVKEVLLHYGLVRDLRDGGWVHLFSKDHRQWHLPGKELLKKLNKQNRLVHSASSLPAAPEKDEEWCKEALATDKIDPLTGIIVTRDIKKVFSSEGKVASIDQLNSTPWWSRCNPSIRIKRTLKDYQESLNLVLRHANSIMFIDPHLDPVQDRYKDFIMLLKKAELRTPPPLIEIHRVIYRGSGKHREILDPAAIEAEFRKELREALHKAALSAKVFIWDDFHDRYVISDLVGISMQNGFDTTLKDEKTTWTLLSRSDRDDIQKEFAPNCPRHKSCHQFSIP